MVSSGVDGISRWNRCFMDPSTVDSNLTRQFPIVRSHADCQHLVQDICQWSRWRKCPGEVQGPSCGNG